MKREYTLEDVETLRGKAGISYEEAVAILDECEGDLTRAMVELEKRGQLGASAHAGEKIGAGDVGEWFRRIWRQAMGIRILVDREGDRVAALPLPLLILMAILGIYAVVAAVVVALLTGCRISIQNREETVHTVMIRDEFIRHKHEKEAEDSAKDADEDKDGDGNDDFPSMTIS